MEVNTFLTKWLEEEVRINHGPNTYDAYSTVVRWHIGAKFGEYELEELRSDEIQAWINELKEKGYSRSTVKTIFTVFNDALRWAVLERHYLNENPMQQVKMPSFTVVHKKPFVFSAQQIQLIFQRFPLGHKYFAPCMIAYCTGLRVGECLALTWSHIDMKKRTISVDSILYDKKGLPVCQTAPETKSSVRTLPFNERLYRALQQHKSQQRKNKRLYGEKYFDSDFVCTREDGRQMTSNDMRYFNMWCKKEFGGGSFHSFRHTHATRMLERQADLRYVSQRLGHSSVITTANIYEPDREKRKRKPKT